MLVKGGTAAKRNPRQLDVYPMNSCDFPLQALHLRHQIPDNWVISQSCRHQKVNVLVLEDALNCTDIINITTGKVIIQKDIQRIPLFHDLTLMVTLKVLYSKQIISSMTFNCECYIWNSKAPILKNFILTQFHHGWIVLFSYHKSNRLSINKMKID